MSRIRVLYRCVGCELDCIVFSTHLSFERDWDVKPVPNPQPWRTSVSLLVWNLIPDLSGPDDPASSYECHLQDIINTPSQRWLTTYDTHKVLEIVR